MNPTAALYNALEVAYSHYNKALFNGNLPSVIFTNQRQKGTLGYFSADRWASTSGENCHEIAINPAYVGKASVLQLLGTLVHEMVHCWQQCHGIPPKSKWHNIEWSNKMLEVGLIPSDTGKPDGKKVGQSMSHYPENNGRFISATVELLNAKKFILPWVDRHAKGLEDNAGDENIEPIEGLQGLDDSIVSMLVTNMDEYFGEDAFIAEDEEAKKKVKSKYNCHQCNINVWGKPKLALKCMQCDVVLAEIQGGKESTEDEE